MNKLTIPSFFATAAAVVAFSSLSPVDAYARGRTSSGHNARGGLFERGTDRTPGTVTKNSSVTNAKGKTTTHSETRSYDPATKNYSASGSTTRPDGKTASHSVNSEKTDTGRIATGEATGFNGKTTTYESTSTKAENGFARESVKTGPNGGTQTKDVTVAKADDGSVTRTITSDKNPPPAAPAL